MARKRTIVDKMREIMEKERKAKLARRNEALMNFAGLRLDLQCKANEQLAELEA